MNKKFFANSLDLFKFDVISYLCGARHILVKDNAEKRKAPIQKRDMYLYYVSMLTKFSGYPKLNQVYDTYKIGDKNSYLSSFLKERYRKENSENDEGFITEISTYFKEAKIQHLSFFLNNIGLFTNTRRKEYFESFINQYELNQDKRERLAKHQRLNSSLVFLDPDNGFIDKSQSGFRKNRNAYLLEDDILEIRSKIISSDVLGFFQILDKKAVSILDRKNILENKIERHTVTIFDWSIKASLVFVLENEEQQIKLKEKLEKYLIDYPNIETEIQRGVI